MSDWAGLAWLVVLLAFNAFFVGAEFAVISARRSQIEPRAEKGSRAAKTALYAMEHATLMLATSQLGITICSLLILNVSEPAIHHLLAGPLGLTGLSEAMVDTIAFIIALVLVSYLHVVFGEMVPMTSSGSPVRFSGISSRWWIAGSDTFRISSEQMVMPSCEVASMRVACSIA